ncbi:tRNA pseudouridine(55) synthase TruB [Porphyromonas bennonis]|uniref:tRNA pseudouridine(55) synthase TruB n=1 Tax=Porphyromonas bennonis TaxID=501496 RepID=UPI00036D0ACF
MDGREERLTRAVYQIGAERGRRRVAPPNPFSDGMIISVDKPLGWTSFDLVNLFRRLACTELNLKRLKVGHAGTLDPLATGVVVLCTGRFTKRIEELQDHDKCYEATIRLGATTPSFDLEHSIDAFFPYDHLTEEEIRTALRSYEGEIDQVPPAYSAAKIGGERAYMIARRGDEVELPAKRVRFDRIELLSYEAPLARVRVTGGKGIFIRALARDLGEQLGCGAHLTRLRRTRVGDRSVEDCIRPEDFESFIRQTLDVYASVHQTDLRAWRDRIAAEGENR